MTTDAAPIQGLSGAEAAKILGVSSELYVYKLVSQGVIPKAKKYARHALDRADAEQLALARYRPGHPYWVKTTAAAEILGLSRQRVKQLAGEGRLPFVEHDGHRFYRRHQVEVIANALEARKLAGTLGMVV